MSWTSYLNCNRCQAVAPADGSTHGLCKRCHAVELTMKPSQPGSTPSARTTIANASR